MAEPVELAPGFWQLELPLPIPRLPSVNAYVFDGPDGVTVVDPGGGHDESHAALLAGLAALGREPGELAAVVATHLHPDHMGIATRLVEETGCRYVMHHAAAANLHRYNDWTTFRQWVAGLAGRHGAPAARVEELGRDEPRPDWAPPSMKPTDLVDDGDEIPVAPGRALTVVHTPGHEDAHICLVDSATRYLMSGDHVLPGITPFVPFSAADPDNLGTYLRSLQRVEDIDPPLTLPAHLQHIERGAARAHQIRLHHRRRLDGMLAELDAGRSTAWEVMEAVFRPNLPPMHTRLAFQETLAHLEHLRVEGRVDQHDAGGTLTYRRRH